MVNSNAEVIVKEIPRADNLNNVSATRVRNALLADDYDAYSRLVASPLKNQKDFETLRNKLNKNFEKVNKIIEFFQKTIQSNLDNGINKFKVDLSKQFKTIKTKDDFDPLRDTVRKGLDKIFGSVKILVRGGNLKDIGVTVK